MPPKKTKGKTKHVEDKVEKKVEEKKVEKKEEPPSAPPVIAPEHEAEPTKPQETIVHESGAAGGDDELFDYRQDEADGWGDGTGGGGGGNGPTEWGHDDGDGGWAGAAEGTTHNDEVWEEDWEDSGHLPPTPLRAPSPAPPAAAVPEPPVATPPEPSIYQSDPTQLPPEEYHPRSFQGPHPPTGALTSASEVAQRAAAAKASQNPQPPTQRPAYYWGGPADLNDRPKQTMAQPNKAVHGASSSFYSTWGQPKDVDPWGEPKPRTAAPAKPPGVKQAWEFWGREAQQATAGRSAQAWDKHDHGDHYADDESQETYGAEDGWVRQPQSGWYQPHKQSKVTFAHPDSDDGTGTRNVLFPQQRSNIMNSVLNALPQNPYGNYVQGHQVPSKQQHSQTYQYEQRKKEEARHPRQGKAKKNKKDQQSGDWGPDGGWDENGAGWDDGEEQRYPQQGKNKKVQQSGDWGPGDGWDDSGTGWGAGEEEQARHPQQGKAKKNKKDQQRGDWGPGDGWDDSGTGWGAGEEEQARYPQQRKAKKNKKDQQSGDWGPGGDWDDSGTGWGAGGGEQARHPQQGKAKKKKEQSSDWGPGDGWDDNRTRWGNGGSDYGWDGDGGGEHGGEHSGNRGRGQSTHDHGNAWGQSKGNHDRGWDQSNEGHDKARARSGGNRGRSNRGHDKGRAQSNTDHDTGWGDHDQTGGEADNWGAANDSWGDTNERHDWGAVGASGHAGDSKTQVHSTWGGSQQTYSMPSKTMTHAYNGTHAPPSNAPQTSKMNDYTNIKFVESQGKAFAKVQTAIFGRERKAKDRIHWMFSPDKDERVSALMGWIASTEYNLGSYGLHKFLQSRERGALFANANFRMEDHPYAPAFDWLTFDQLRETRDPILQNSAIRYDPAMVVCVFVFLPSESGNSVAMWRRKINVPNNTRLRFQHEIGIAKGGLRKDKDYVVHVDELPRKDKIKKGTLTRKRKPLAPTTDEKKKKRKWWQVLRFAV